MSEPITVKVSRMDYRAFVCFVGNNPILETFITATATTLSGQQLQENKTDDDYFAEIEFPTIRAASRFTRMLDQFEPPAGRNNEAAWSVALTQLYRKMLRRSLSSYAEDKRGTAWKQILI